MGRSDGKPAGADIAVTAPIDRVLPRRERQKGPEA